MKEGDNLFSCFVTYLLYCVILFMYFDVEVFKGICLNK